MELFLAIVSLIVSIYALYKRKIDEICIKRRKRLYKVSLRDTYAWLCRYYIKTKDVTLYQCKLKNDYIIPFIVKKEWLHSIDLKSVNKPILKYSNLDNKSTLSDKQLDLIIDKKEHWGQTLFNGKTLCINKNTIDNETIFYTEVAYFDLAGCVIEYENETYKAINSHFSKTPLRDKFLSNIETIMDGTLSRRISLGGSVVTCMKRKEGPYNILLHKRSNNVITARGAKSIIPQFGFESINQREIDSFSEIKYPYVGLIFYNIIKEFVEELFNYEELIQNIGAKKIMGKFSEIEEIKILIDAYNKNQLKIIYLGHGFEMLIGTKILSFLLLIEDEDISEKLISNFDINWEIDNIRESIEMIELSKSGISLLDNYQKNGELTSSSSFALSRAFEWLSSNKYIII